MGRDFLLKLELVSNPNMLCVVRAAMERLTETFGFSAPDCRSVTRAVDEALTNIMRHAYGGQLGRPIEVYCRRVRQGTGAGGREAGRTAARCALVKSSNGGLS